MLHGVRSLKFLPPHVSKDHTAENLAEELKCITDEWKITNKEVAVVTDNAANIVAAV